MKPCGLPSLVTGLTLVLTSSARLKTHESVLDSLDGSIKRQTQSESERPSVISSFVSNETGLSNGTWPWQIYKTEPYNPPVLEINATGEALSPGYIFISPSNFEPTETPSGVKQSGPLIFTDKGQLVWNGPASDPTADYNTNDFRVQSVNGTDYLTYWYGYNSAGANIGHGFGNVTFLDDTYTEKYVVCPDLDLAYAPSEQHGCPVDLHEHQVTPWGTLLVTVYNYTTADLTSFGGPADGYLLDCLAVEVDIPTSNVLWTWSALEHVALNTSRNLPFSNTTGTKDKPWDWFHANSIGVAGDDILFNSRHTWEFYLIEKATGNISWTLNGETGGDFGPLPSDGHFRWQHHVRATSITKDSITLTLFNNYNAAGAFNGTAPSNGLALQLPLPPDKKQSPRVVTHLETADDPIYADSQGSYASLSDGENTTTHFLDYGQIPLLREYGPNANGSNLRWQARLGADSRVQSYRGFKSPWTGKPQQAPKLAVEDGVAYVSWNGATEVRGWDVYGADSKEALELVGYAEHVGFETGFKIDEKCVQVSDNVGSQRSDVVCS